jgi:MoaD family protein
MEIKIKLLKPFSNAVGKKELDLDFKGSKIFDLLKFLVDKYPQLKREFFNEKGELTEYICIFINDKPASVLNGIETKLKSGDEILFFIPISGG